MIRSGWWILLPIVISVAGCEFSDNDVAPEVIGFALYEDQNLDGVLNAGDELILTFSQALTLGSVSASDFDLPVAGDTLGGTPTFVLGPDTDQVTIILGVSPSFSLRQFFSGNRTAAGDPSGIDVSSSIASGSIVGSEGETADPSVVADLAPAYSDTSQAFTAYQTQDGVGGDFDGDGDEDLFLVNEGEGNRLLRNNSAGVFVDSGQSLGSGPSYGGAAGDFDGDGDLDVAVANEFGSTNLIWLNDGAGNFTAGGNFGTGGSRDVVAADFDADGDLDLAVANSGANRIYTNNGSASFTQTTQSLGSAGSYGVAASDFDRDGDVDIAFANSASPGRVYSNNGSALFTAVADLAGPSQGRAIAAGDLDRDGFPDAVIGSLDRGVTAFFNTGPSSFPAEPSYGTGSVISVTLGDIDGDADLDIVEGRTTLLADRVWFNDGIGNFDDSGMRLGAVSTTAVILEDHDHDGDLDLYAAALGASGLVYRNPYTAALGGFHFTDSGQSLTNNGDPSQNITLDAVIADIDIDGDLDYINGAAPNGAGRVWIGDGFGVFTLGTALGTFGLSVEGVAVGDLDADGLPDVLIGRATTTTLVFRNNGSGSFVAIGSVPSSTGATQLQLADLDGDTDLDLVTDDSASTTTKVYLNDGAGNFTDNLQSIGGFSPAGVALGDVDLDGDIDVVVGRDGGANEVWLNNGTASFTDSGQLLGSLATQQVVLANIDGGADLELIEATDGGNRVYTNMAGIFTDTLQNLGIDDTRRLAMIDVDGDGDLDAVEANVGTDSRIRLNNGAGLFTDSGLLLVTDGSARTVVAGDVDLDGDIDLIFGTTAGDRVLLRD